MTHKLDGSSSREYQQWKPSKGAAHDSLAGWEFIQGMSAMETKQGIAHDSQAGWEFIQGMSAMEIKHRCCI